MSNQWNEMTDAEKIEALRLGLVNIAFAFGEFAKAQAKAQAQLSHELMRWSDEFQQAFGGKSTAEVERDRLIAQQRFEQFFRSREPAADTPTMEQVAPPTRPPAPGRSE